jgi:hypothetical protein
VPPLDPPEPALVRPSPTEVPGADPFAIPASSEQAAAEIASNMQASFRFAERRSFMRVTGTRARRWGLAMKATARGQGDYAGAARFKSGKHGGGAYLFESSTVG